LKIILLRIGTSLEINLAQPTQKKSFKIIKNKNHETSIKQSSRKSYSRRNKKPDSNNKGNHRPQFQKKQEKEFYCGRI